MKVVHRTLFIVLPKEKKILPIYFQKEILMFFTNCAAWSVTMICFVLHWNKWEKTRLSIQINCISNNSFDFVIIYWDKRSYLFCVLSNFWFTLNYFNVWNDIIFAFVKTNYLNYAHLSHLINLVSKCVYFVIFICFIYVYICILIIVKDAFL